MKITYTLSLLSISLLIASCSVNKSLQTVLVKNTLELERSSETVSLTKAFLKVESLEGLGVKDNTTNKLVVTQLVDVDGDGTMDELLFQPNVSGNSEVSYNVVKVTDKDVKPAAIDLCFSRFVPERIDDYAWENDKVAFRMYGPEAQKLFYAKHPQGSLSSGIDAWMKRVSYPVINKWYKETMIDKTGSYHEDTGEGCDIFHVGISRGIGGITVKTDSTYHVSENFTNWRTITTGPLRTSFQLDYAAWDAGGKKITETKTITLDLGNNLSRVELNIEGVDQIESGLTLHNKDGEVIANDEKGWITYWEPIGDSEIGAAIVADKATYVDSNVYKVDTRDLSHAYAKYNVKNNKVVYYSGFGWKKSKQFNSKEEWTAYLNAFSDKVNNPLLVSLK